VKIDPAFAETISEAADYHVFITPRGDSKGLYVIHATAAGFEVRESGGGTSSLTFDYKIVGKRRGYEAQRLRDVTADFAQAKASAAHADANRPPASPGIRRAAPARTIATKRPEASLKPAYRAPAARQP